MQKITAPIQAAALPQDSCVDNRSIDQAIVQLPNLVIAGAPKCGTSSLFYWLAAHPEVYGSNPKEAFYFMDEFHGDEPCPLLDEEANYHRHGLSRYRVFPQSDAKIFVEATTHYLYQKTARDFFAVCNPQPLILVVLRKPSDRIYSSFSYTQNNLARLDRSVSFAEFVDLLLNDRVDEIKKHFHSDRSFFVLKRDLLYSQYADFLQDWAKRFPANRLKIVLFEQLKANPQAVLKSIAQDLKIDDRFYDSFALQQQNQTVAIGNSWAHRMLRQVAPRLPQTELKAILKSLYFRMQGSGQERSNQSAADLQAIEKLDRYFEPYNQQLAAAFDLDLSCWQ